MVGALRPSPKYFRLNLTSSQRHTKHHVRFPHLACCFQHAMMTREASPRVEARSKKLELPYYFPGILDKLQTLPEVLKITGLEIGELGYIGDDFNDLEIMEAISKEGLTATPADGMPQMHAHAHYIAKAPGGYGAFRDFAEWILENRKE